jgi:hypothetical protein
MNSSSLLAHLSKNFAPHPENIATEALGHILNNSRPAREGIHTMFAGIGLSSDITFRTQQSEQDSQSRPDITGMDNEGRTVFLIEAKFWAGLTENQPTTYIGLLEAEVPSVLCFVVPEQRGPSLWPEVCKRAADSGYPAKANYTGEFRRTQIGPKKYLAMVSWGYLLNVLENRASASGDTLTVSDISQLRGLCAQQESEGFLPLRSAELGPEIPNRILGLGKVVDQVIESLVQEGYATIQGFRASDRHTGHRRYFNTVPALLAIEGEGLQLEYNHELWAIHESPIWLGVYWSSNRTALKRSALKLLESYELEQPPRMVRDTEGGVFFRVTLPVGAEFDDVVYSVEQQVKAVLDDWKMRLELG